MAELTDEEKAKKLEEEVETPKGADEASDQVEEPTNQEEEAQAEDQVEEDKPTETQDEAPTFTKPEGYEWLKGDTAEEVFDSLKQAYENSTAEALRLRQTQTSPPAETTEETAPVSDPALAYAQSMMQRDMVDSFGEFAKKFPQAREPQGFDQFEKASRGASQAFMDVFGRVPTYPELFEKTASLLGWQSSDKNAQKDAALKNSASAGNTTNSAPAPKPRTNVTQAQLDAAKRFFPGKSDSELVKELQADLA